MIVTLLRKTLEKTVAENALKHGCGALNIDATRVGTEARNYKGAGKTDKVYSASGAGMLDGRGKEMEFQVEGRWPANFILTHLEGCELKGTKKVRGVKGGTGNHKGSVYGERSNVGSLVKDYADEDGKEEVANWACAEGCPVKVLDSQSGSLVSGSRSSKVYKDSSSTRTVYGKYEGVQKEIKGSSGGASRFFKQLKNFEELVTYLTVLISPPQKDANVFMGDIDELLEEDLEQDSLHGAVIVGDFSEGASEHLFRVCKRGAHVVVIPYEDYDPHTIAYLENIGFEVRDSLFVAETEAFFYASKASKKERQAGLDDRNPHPTVKPIAVMEWCLRDLPRTTKTVFDPFTGSGTTGIAALRKGFDFIGCELDKDFAKIARARLKHEHKN